MVEGRHRLDVVLEQGVHKAVVEIETCWIDLARAIGQHACPSDAETIGFEAQLGHEGNIEAEAAIVVARDVPGVAIADHARRMGKAMPDAGARTIGEVGALYLIRRGGAPPHEMIRKRVPLLQDRLEDNQVLG